MKIKLLCILLVFCALAGIFPVSAASLPSSEQILASVAEAAEAKDRNAWIEQVLVPMIGNGGEDFAYALLGMENSSGLSPVFSQAERLLSSETASLSAVTRQNLTFLLYLGGKESRGELVQGEGVMWDIYSSLLFSRGLSSDAAALSRLLSEQLPDGGWSLRGSASDVDVTAMALRALALSGKNGEDASVKQALAFLEKAQQEDGSFVSYGAANCESTAQVVIALCALGIDPKADPRFSRVPDALYSFFCEGGFSHVQGGAVSTIATGQGLLACVCLERLQAGKADLWSLQPRAESSSVPQGSIQSTSPSSPEDLGYRLPLSLLILGLMAAACLGLLLLKKTHRNNFIAVFLCGALLLCGVWFLNVRSSEEYYSSAEEGEAVGTVLLSIQCDTLLSLESAPDNTRILDRAEVPLMQGDTAYDVLVRGAKLHRLRLEIKGGGALSYVSAIEDLKELQYGDLSGWMFFVNGEEASVGCAEFRMNDGDLLEWKYTLALGKDLEGK